MLCDRCLGQGTTRVPSLSLSLARTHTYSLTHIHTHTHTHIHTHAHIHTHTHTHTIAWHAYHVPPPTAGKDHPLNTVGVDQCVSFNRRWRALADGTVKSKAPLGSLQKHFEDGFTACQAVFTSPLTRAVQTAMIALDGHPALESAPIICMRSAREIKGVGGRDCLGKVCGENIELRARSELATLRDADFVNALKSKIHSGDSNSEWWTYFKDTRGSTKLRFHDFWQTIRFCEADKIIIAGHSNFFKKLLKLHSGQATCDDPRLRDVLLVRAPTIVCM